MAADQYNAPPTWRVFIFYAYIVCNCLFLVETWLRLLAAGTFAQFFASKFHKFELVCVGCGIIGLVTNSKMLLLVPSVRLYRLMGYIPTLEALLLSAVASVQAIFNLGVFIVVIAISVCITGR